MKKYFNHITMLLLAALAFAGCEKSDSDQDFGTTNIYMPQATMNSGYYNVPSGRDSSTYNYKIESSKVNVILGAYRSGTQALQAYDVKVAANADTITALLNSNVIDPATTMVLPSTIYTLPSSLAVPDGKNAGTFYLSIDKEQLKTYAGKKLAIAVKITDPTMYTLLPVWSTTIVIVDVDALHL